MSDTIKTQYKDFEIEYNENEDVWIGKLEGNEVNRSNSLVSLRKLLDKFNKDNDKFERVNVISYDSYHGKREDDGFFYGTVTSVSDNGEPWVTWKNKRREKVYRSKKLYLDTPENRSKIESYNEIRQQIDDLRNKQNDILDSMERFDSEKHELNSGGHTEE